MSYDHSPYAILDIDENFFHFIASESGMKAEKSDYHGEVVFYSVVDFTEQDLFLLERLFDLLFSPNSFGDVYAYASDSYNGLVT